MPRYMLDTNICIYIINKRPVHVLQRLRHHSIDDIGVSIITLCELEYGATKSSNEARNRGALAGFASGLQILQYDGSAAYHYGLIRNELEKQGKPIGPLDMLIAAHARSLNLTLITNNIREFKRVGGLKIENWADPS